MACSATFSGGCPLIAAMRPATIIGTLTRRLGVMHHCAATVMAERLRRAPSEGKVRP
jgi:hypothetical protein